MSTLLLAISYFFTPGIAGGCLWCNQHEPPRKPQFPGRVCLVDSDGIDLAVLLIQAREIGGLQLLDALEVLVGVELIRFQLDHRDGDIGAVVGDAFKIRQKVVKDKADLDGTLALL